jgi:hypothetical protein
MMPCCLHPATARFVPICSRSIPLLAFTIVLAAGTVLPAMAMPKFSWQSNDNHPIALELCRRLAPLASDLSDVDLARLRDEMYALAEMALDLLQTTTRRGNEPAIPVDADERATLLERASILEFEAGMTRDAATGAAVAQFIRRKART